ncbi:hypothetical protein QBC46DRAFT_43349 [Diplogelasinospora grovesii]|uniref:Uncharacterized protein n=1 Tax=Diplogelasinospora grovesii TaxID=303347 RepID=A0AAN6NEA3_9PEZI|nr:hypothetical protein QBC46DRAFT_43349 [Diplogelasinospora grovesii]
MAILAAPTTDPSVALRQRSDLISVLGPLVGLAPQFRHLLTLITTFLFIHTYFAASIVATALSQASLCVLFKTAGLTKRVSWTIWNAKATKRLRKKLEFEFFVLILGPGGNALCLMVFWPGWLIIGATIWAVWPATG